MDTTLSAPKTVEYIKKATSLAVADPKKAAMLAHRELNWGCRELNLKAYQWRGKPDGVDLMAEDWDTALILDACRFDAFAACNRFGESNLQCATSVGTDSLEFIQHTFANRKLHDTVYVTANPYATVLESDVFHDVILDEAWDSSSSEAPAGRVTAVAKDAHEQYPHKRIIVHYVQPHLPILAPESRWINEKLDHWKTQYWPVDASINTVRKGYRDNLEYVLDHVEQLLETIKGNIVITADHGELLGERQWPIPIRGFDHFAGLYHPKLLEVPWLNLDNGERRDVISEPPKNEFSVDERAKNERLEALGYI